MPSLVLLTCANSASAPLSMLNTTNPVVAQYATALTVIAISPSCLGFEPPPRRPRQYDACRSGEIDSPARDTSALFDARTVVSISHALARRMGKEREIHP